MSNEFLTKYFWDSPDSKIESEAIPIEISSFLRLRTQTHENYFRKDKICQIENVKPIVIIH